MTRWPATGFVSLLAITAPSAVIAAEYLSVEQAQQRAFPGAERFEAVALQPTAAQVAAVTAKAGPQPRRGHLVVYRALRGGETLGHLVVDEVIGRQEFITYAVAIDRDGRLGTPEILAYRETHGSEIRSQAWRRQFAGRQELTALRFRTDIKNIAGATLSCEHVTQGARFALALWQTMLATPVPR